MNRLCTRTAVAVVSAAALILGGCATANTPSAQSDSTSADGTSPPTSRPSGLASPRNLLERYPELKYQDL